MAIKNNPEDMVLDIIKIIAGVIIGFIIIKTLLNLL